VSKHVVDDALILPAPHRVAEPRIGGVPEGMHGDAFPKYTDGLAIFNKPARDAWPPLAVLPLRLEVREQRVMWVRRYGRDMLEEAEAH
jgi:hypothetical protein